MKYLKTYKIFESKWDVPEIKDVIDDCMIHLKDDGYGVNVEFDFDGVNVQINNKGSLFNFDDIKQTLTELISQLKGQGSNLKNIGYKIDLPYGLEDSMNWGPGADSGYRYSKSIDEVDTEGRQVSVVEIWFDSWNDEV